MSLRNTAVQVNPTTVSKCSDVCALPRQGVVSPSQRKYGVIVSYRLGVGFIVGLVSPESVAVLFFYVSDKKCCRAACVG